MKNKVELKKTIYACIFAMIIFISLFGIIYYHQYKKYTINFNDKINSIMASVLDKYPNVSETELIDALNSKDVNDNVLLEYGINIFKNNIVFENIKCFKKYLIVNLLILLVSMLIILLLFLRYNYKKNKSLVEITKYIEAINQKNYQLDIDSNSEDELSILKNEIYKTTIMLNKMASNSLKDKINLKKNLEDISHQLKTPLTSIIIMLDNILNYPNMSKEDRTDFLKEIKRNVVSINLLIQNLLKLSKFDANTIKFINKEYLVIDIIKAALKNNQLLLDLKNIQVELVGDSHDVIVCDFFWQVEAITNILKNSIEYSNDYGKIKITWYHNKIYEEITINDNGIGICKNDISHIFERFYRGKNSNDDSCGIGLSLAKNIIEKSNGQISVESVLGKGTSFKIKYYYINFMLLEE